jgi:hypothetical protein
VFLFGVAELTSDSGSGNYGTGALDDDVSTPASLAASPQTSEDSTSNSDYTRG